MNEEFKRRCLIPQYFESIKYLVHYSDNYENLILEIAEVNPYLAVTIYLTSEVSYIKDKIIELLDNLDETSFVLGVSKAYAFYILGDNDRSMGLCKYIFNEYGKEFYSHEDYWQKKWIELLVAVDNGALLYKYIRGRQISRDITLIDVDLKKLIESDSWEMIFTYVENFGEYGALNDCIWEYEGILSRVYATFGGYKIDTHNTAVKTISAMYLRKYGITNEWVELEKVYGTNRRFAFLKKMRKEYEKVSNPKRKQFFLPLEYMDNWDSYANGIDRPYSYYPHKYIWVKCNFCGKKKKIFYKNIYNYRCQNCVNECKQGWLEKDINDINVKFAAVEELWPHNKQIIFDKSCIDIVFLKNVEWDISKICDKFERFLSYDEGLMLELSFNKQSEYIGKIFYNNKLQEQGIITFEKGKVKSPLFKSLRSFKKYE